MFALLGYCSVETRALHLADGPGAWDWQWVVVHLARCIPMLQIFRDEVLSISKSESGRYRGKPLGDATSRR